MIFVPASYLWDRDLGGDNCFQFSLSKEWMQFLKQCELVGTQYLIINMEMPYVNGKILNVINILAQAINTCLLYYAAYQ